jgi:hypothetical protein
MSEEAGAGEAPDDPNSKLIPPTHPLFYNSLREICIFLYYCEIEKERNLSFFLSLLKRFSGGSNGSMREARKQILFGFSTSRVKAHLIRIWRERETGRKEESLPFRERNYYYYYYDSTPLTLLYIF